MNEVPIVIRFHQIEQKLRFLEPASMYTDRRKLPIKIPANLEEALTRRSVASGHLITHHFNGSNCPFAKKNCYVRQTQVIVCSHQPASWNEHIFERSTCLGDT